MHKHASILQFGTSRRITPWVDATTYREMWDVISSILRVLVIFGTLFVDPKKEYATAYSAVSHKSLLGRSRTRKKVVRESRGHEPEVSKVGLMCCTVVLRTFLCLPVKPSAWSCHYLLPGLSLSDENQNHRTIFWLEHITPIISHAFCFLNNLFSPPFVSSTVVNSSRSHYTRDDLYLYIYFENLFITVLYNLFTPNHNPTIKCTTSGHWLSVLRHTYSCLYVIPYRVHIIRTMGKGIDWKSPEAFTRLLAAIVAAQDLKVRSSPQICTYGNLILILPEREWNSSFALLAWFFSPLCHIWSQLSWLTFSSQLDYRKIASMYGQGMCHGRLPSSFHLTYHRPLINLLFRTNLQGSKFPPRPLSRQWQPSHNKLISW